MWRWFVLLVQIKLKDARARLALVEDVYETRCQVPVDGADYQSRCVHSVILLIECLDIVQQTARHQPEGYERGTGA